MTKLSLYSYWRVLWF